MKKQLLSAILVAGSLTFSSAQLKLGNYNVDTVVVAKRLHVPWEILWGPDDKIWYTERDGTISRLDPVTKVSKVLIDIPNVSEQSESGLLGLAIHPQFPDSAYVYAVYTYQSSGMKERLVRFTYNSAQDILTNEKILINNITGNTTHDGSRLLFGPDGKLYMTTGDAQDMPSAQDLNSLNGKILRINPNGTVPADNPNPATYVWSYGHRNPQGLTFSPNGTLYNSEHGASENDEINLIEKSKNYGWPNVRGFCDNDFDYDQDPARDENYYCNLWSPAPPLRRWSPTIATAGLEYYGADLFPAFKNTLLLTSLKERDVRVLTLAADGKSITNESTTLNNTLGRIRDLCIGKDGEIYFATSNQDGRGTPVATDDRIIKFTPSVPTSLDNVSFLNQVVLYPNPAQNRVSIKGIQEEAELELSSLEGKPVTTRKIVNNQFDISELQTGYYLYKIKASSGLVKAGKLVISRQ